MNKTLKTTLIAATTAAAVVTVSAVAILGINQLRADQAAADQSAQEQAIVEQQAETFDALVVKFADPADFEGEKAPPPPPPPAPEPVVEAAPEPEPEYSGVSGLQVPWIPSSDPQNAAGGDWDMSVCQGGSASTGADGIPYCD